MNIKYHWRNPSASSWIRSSQHFYRCTLKTKKEKTEGQDTMGHNDLYLNAKFLKRSAFNSSGVLIVNTNRTVTYSFINAYEVVGCCVDN